MKDLQRGNLQAAITAQFPTRTYEDWLEVANKSLKGKTVSEFVRNTYEDIKIKPLYTNADLPKKQIDLGEYESDWKIAQQIIGESIEEINKNLHEAIEYGQNTISIKIPNDLNKNNIGKLFGEINFDELSFFIDGKEEILPFYQILLDYVENNNIKGFIGFDPVRTKVESGNDDEKYLFQLWIDSIKTLSKQAPNLKTIFVDGRVFEQTGGNAVQQIAYTLSSAVEQIEQLKNADFPIEQFFKKAVVALNVQSNFFMEIAKLRAIRYLWYKLAEAYDVDKTVATLDLFAETTLINKSNLDIYTNMLRTGGEAFAAVVGQVQTLRVHPFDAVNENPSKLGIRVARNIHHLLREESSLANVKDPAQGSYFIENLTNELIEKSWQLFLQIEKQGGFLEAFNSDAIQQQINENREKVLADFYTRKTKLIGTNQFVDLTEELSTSKPVVPNRRKLKQISFNELVENIAKDASIQEFFIEGEQAKPQKFEPFRLSEAYENLRFKAYERSKEGNELKIGLIGLGLLKDYKKVTDFVSDFCAGGGILAEPLQEEINLEEIPTVVSGAKEKIIGFAGTDDQFANAKSIIYKTIEQNRDKTYLVAGLKNKEMLNELIELGVKFFIDSKTNHVETLQQLHVELGGDQDETGV